MKRSLSRAGASSSSSSAPVSVFGTTQRYRPAMPTGSTIALFAAAALALAVVPGPAVTYIVTQSIDKGRRAGLTSALGIASGGLVHVAAATAGLSALIASSATAFTVVKLVGAAYLIGVGIRRILTRDDTVTETQPAVQRLYTQGVVVNVLNPKTALFFLAFLPQFVDPHRGSVPLQVAFLGFVFALIAFLSDSTYAVLADALAGRLRRSDRALRIRRWASGGIFVALGVTAAAAHRS
jgi:threonine/homoserine/homoserine lactone efflux protein